MSDPKIKNIPLKSDMDKISPDDNTNLTDNNEIGLSPNGINNKGKTPGNSSSLNNDKTTIGKDARSYNQQNDGTINSFADGLNSLADTSSNSPVKPDNNISDKSGISQKTKELVSLQSELAKKVTGSEVNGKKDENLLSLDGSKPMPVKPNTATPRDDNQGFYKQTESGEIKRLYPDTATSKNDSKIFFQENEGSGVIQSESGEVKRMNPDTATVKSGNLVVEGVEIAKTESSKVEYRNLINNSKMDGKHIKSDPGNQILNSSEVKNIFGL